MRVLLRRHQEYQVNVLPTETSVQASGGEEEEDGDDEEREVDIGDEQI